MLGRGEVETEDEERDRLDHEKASLWPSHHNVAPVPKPCNDHYLFLIEDNTLDLQILSQLLQMSYKSTEGFQKL